MVQFTVGIRACVARPSLPPRAAQARTTPRGTPTRSSTRTTSRTRAASLSWCRPRVSRRRRPEAPPAEPSRTFPQVLLSDGAAFGGGKFQTRARGGAPQETSSSRLPHSASSPLWTVRRRAADNRAQGGRRDRLPRSEVRRRRGPQLHVEARASRPDPLLLPRQARAPRDQGDARPAPVARLLGEQAHVGGWAGCRAAGEGRRGQSVPQYCTGGHSVRARRARSGRAPARRSPRPPYP